MCSDHSEEKWLQSQSGFAYYLVSNALLGEVG